MIDQLKTFLDKKQKTTIECNNNWSITLSIKEEKEKDSWYKTKKYIFAHFIYNSGCLDFDPSVDEYHKIIKINITPEELYTELKSSNGIIYEQHEDTWHYFSTQ